MVAFAGRHGSGITKGSVMQVAGEAVQAVGDYDLRGQDYETLLVGALTGSIGDADRLIARGHGQEGGWSNGFPNFAMYRTAYCGDSHLAADLRLWCEAFAVAHCMCGGMRSPDDAVAVCAGRDAYIALTTTRWGAPADELATALGIAPKTYRRLRKEVLVRLVVSLREYWIRLQVAIRQVGLMEKRAESATPLSRLSDGRGWHDVDFAGDGNYRAMPRGSVY